MDGCGLSSQECLDRRCDDGSRPYVRRHPEDGVLHQVLREHLETFLEEARRRGDGEGLPRFVERELREYLSCGSMGRGFARFRCDGCGHEILVAFSCKGRGFCPSCCGRRMAELAAHLVDDVLGGLPVRQWVLTVPHRLRYAMAWDHNLCRAVLGVFIRALLGFERRRAERRGIPGGRGGAVTAIQRFGSSLNLNVHFHTLAVQGVFVDDGRGGLRFVRNPEPSDTEVAELLVTISRRITRLVRRRGIDLESPHDEIDAVDPLADESPVLAGLSGASVLGRVATGKRAGRRVLRVGVDLESPVVTSGGERQAHLGGFDLHANVAVPAGQRERLEHLCGYVLRPPVAQGALSVAQDGRLLLDLRRPWRDGTRAILFEPHELIERLSALIPKPRINLLLYHGVFGPAAKLRGAAVAVALGSSQRPTTLTPPPSTADPAEMPSPAPADTPAARPLRAQRRAHFPWADLLERTFGIDILACPGCGGRLRFLATIEEPRTIRRILDHLGIPADLPESFPARSPPGPQESFPFPELAD